jgi:hypothetical protein
MWMLYFHAEAASPCVDATGGNRDLISCALVVCAAESSFVNVRQDGAFRHPGTSRDLGRGEVLLDDGEGNDDIDQLVARFRSKRPRDLLSTFPRKIHSVREDRFSSGQRVGTYVAALRADDVP